LTDAAGEPPLICRNDAFECKLHPRAVGAQRHVGSSPLPELCRPNDLHHRVGTTRKRPRPPGLFLRVLQTLHLGNVAAHAATTAIPEERVGRLIGGLFQVLVSATEPTNEIPRNTFARMPLYTFNLAPGPILDEQGLELPDDNAARVEAELIARDIVRNRAPTINERIVASKTDGTIVHEVYLQNVAMLK